MRVTVSEAMHPPLPFSRQLSYLLTFLAGVFFALLLTSAALAVKDREIAMWQANTSAVIHQTSATMAVAYSALDTCAVAPSLAHKPPR